MKDGPIRPMPAPPLPKLGILFWLSFDAVITSELHCLGSPTELCVSRQHGLEETNETILTDLSCGSVWKYYLLVL